MKKSNGVPGLKIVDAFDLDEELRSILRPGEMMLDAEGRRHKLPRYFYEIPSHEAAVEVRLTQHFGLNELIFVDIKEAARLQNYPRYIPCAVRVLAFYLQRFRETIGSTVHVAVNGGYRSPAHKLAHSATPHMWGTAVDLYRIGSTILKNEESIEKFNRIASELSSDLYAMPYGHGTGMADDHVHLDIGYVTVVPKAVSEDHIEVPQHRPRFAWEDRRARERRVNDESARPEE
jgi:hypothetical protein